MEFQHTIAPRELFLPNIMTMYDKEEREALFTIVRKKIVAGKWKGNQKGRPTVQLTTKRAIQERKNGERAHSSKLINGRLYYQEPQAIVAVTHAVLVMHGHFPQEDDQASHLCHNGTCVRVEHLVWESANANTRRLRCQRNGKCECRLTPKCLMKCLP